MTRIALLNIGSELLIGRTVNTNATSMALKLRAKGYHLDTTIVCHDTGPEILHWINELLQAHDVILITGGLGPTKDDITKTILLERFGGEMVVHEETLANITQYLKQHNRPLSELNRQQAFVPSSCEVLLNTSGSAPGMAFREDGKSVIAMPGVPLEMKHLMDEKVVPYLGRHHPTLEMHTRILRMVGIPESGLAEKMEPLEPDFPAGLEVAYLPSYEGIKVELRMKGNNREEVEAAIESTMMKIVARFKKYIYSVEDKRPVELLKEYMFETGETMATAESCTGGGIAAIMVQQSGISAVFKGGVVAYMREIKESVLGVAPETIDTFGIVSAEVAKEMALGAREKLGSDFAISITGIAEAAPNAPESEMPQCWIGFSSAEKEEAFYFKLFRHRKQNIAVATQAALIFALGCLKG